MVVLFFYRGAQLTISVHHPRTTFPRFFEARSRVAPGSLSRVFTVGNSPAPLVYFLLTTSAGKFFVPPLARERAREHVGPV